MPNEEVETEMDNIVEDFESSPDGELKAAMQDENMPDEEADYQQGFSQGSYPEQPVRDSIFRFNRWIIGLLHPKEVVRAANFTFADKKNAIMCLNMAFYNEKENARMLQDWWNTKAVHLASVSMGHKGFLMINMMTQRRIVSRQNENKPKISNWNQPQGGQK